MLHHCCKHRQQACRGQEDARRDSAPLDPAPARGEDPADSPAGRRRNRRNHFDQSLSAVESGLELDAANPELVKLRARPGKRRKGRMGSTNCCVRRRRRGARATSRRPSRPRRGAQVDQTNPQNRRPEQRLAKEAEQAQKHAQAKLLLDSARARSTSAAIARPSNCSNRWRSSTPPTPRLPLLQATPKRDGTGPAQGSDRQTGGGGAHGQQLGAASAGGQVRSSRRWPPCPPRPRYSG